MAPEASARRKTMYPNLKVRGEEDDDFCYEPEVKPRLPLEAFESLSLHHMNSSVQECEDDSPTPTVRVPKCYMSNSAIPVMTLPKGEGKNNEKADVEDSKQNIRASSIPRPRAVLSSPDNDGVIGSRNEMKAELISGLKDHNLCQNRHIRCKVVPRRDAHDKIPITKGRESKEAADDKTNLKEKRGAAAMAPRQRAPLRKAKPDWV